MPIPLTSGVPFVRGSFWDVAESSMPAWQTRPKTMDKPADLRHNPGPLPDFASQLRNAPRWDLPRLLLTLLICICAWAIVACACMCVGSTGRTFHWPTTPGQLHWRREMVLMASLIGAALASAGVVYQAILRNPLADPYLLGVSSGAMLASFIWRFSSLAILATAAAAAGQQAFAFSGAIITIAIVFLLSMRRGKLEPITLLLVGVIVNSINGAIFLLLNRLKQDLAGASGGEISFLIGGIQTNLTASQEYATAIAVGICWIVLLYLAGQLNAAILSESEASSLGVRIHRLRWIALLAASLMTAAAVAVSGPIGFIGLVCPHLSRLIVGNDQRRLLPVATAMGAALLAIADALSRSITRTMLPVGVLTGLLGGPFYLLLLWRARNRLTV
jgi:iron complex transport system permease protein